MINEKWIVDLMFLLVMVSALMYIILTKNDMRIYVAVIWSIVYLGNLICGLVKIYTRHKRLDREAKEKWEEMFGNKGE